MTAIICSGSSGGFRALHWARDYIARYGRCLVGAADSLIGACPLANLAAQRRLLTDANKMEIAHKAGGNKVVAAFPDVCMSPPGPPTGPVPVPYADTSMASDLEKGTKDVKIGGQPAALYQHSHYSSSPLGNEAATRSFGGSMLTATITGKTYFQAGSMNVSFEGKKVCRHLDLTMSNHGSQPPGTPPLPGLESMSMGAGDDAGDED